MQIKVKSIPAGGLELFEEKPGSFISEATDEIRFTGKVSLKANIDKTDSAILANISASGKLVSDCSRCLTETGADWEREFTLDFPINKNTEIVELDEDIRQEIIVNIPILLLCKDDCRGLCLGCKVNLNLEKCKCNK
ncbi:MAG: DUF177 domain-containing protein [Candidatus Omnitrophica bacterium]|nr:DUF177 domain-containing protein [Candidatus Omnitrophota bacterium]